MHLLRIVQHRRCIVITCQNKLKSYEANSVRYGLFVGSMMGNDCCVYIKGQQTATARNLPILSGDHNVSLLI